MARSVEEILRDLIGQLAMTLAQATARAEAAEAAVREARSKDPSS